jgi:hypothetical protein
MEEDTLMAKIGERERERERGGRPPAVWAMMGGGNGF